MINVKMSVGVVTVQKEQTAPSFVVSDNNGKLGELRVSRGGIRWLAKGKQEEPYFANWKRFDAWMRTQKRR